MCDRPTKRVGTTSAAAARPVRIGMGLLDAAALSNRGQSFWPTLHTILRSCSRCGTNSAALLD
jgi:hypothetical protein